MNKTMKFFIAACFLIGQVFGRIGDNNHRGLSPISCYVRKWDGRMENGAWTTQNYCEPKENCEQWEIDTGDTWSKCCEAHCQNDGLFLNKPDNVDPSQPVASPTPAPTQAPVQAPTNPPTNGPTNTPTNGPTNPPTNGPTNNPDAPAAPTTKAPTRAPTQYVPGKSLKDNTDRSISYLTSWGIPSSAGEDIKASNGEGYLLSFGQWDAQGDLTFSEGIADIPEYNPWYIESPAYQVWTGLKHENPDASMLVAFGGQTYEGIWSHMETSNQRERLANKLVDLLHVNFPVYKKNAKADEIIGCMNYNGDGSQCDLGTYQLVGYVQLDGLDFDFEKAARITEQENRNLEDLIAKIRSKIGNTGEKVLSLTTYHVGADPVECSNDSIFEVDGLKCSYIDPSGRSKHHGEITSLLQNTKDQFDFFNVMTYDAGEDFLYKESMRNFAAAVGDRSKIVLGNTINKQWTPNSQDGFIESRENNLERAAWQRKEGFGGFFMWTLGATSGHQMSFADQVEYFNEQIRAASGSGRRLRARAVM